MEYGIDCPAVCRKRSVLVASVRGISNLIEVQVFGLSDPVPCVPIVPRLHEESFGLVLVRLDVMECCCAHGYTSSVSVS